jgi:hypothetical protein
MQDIQGGIAGQKSGNSGMYFRFEVEVSDSPSMMERSTLPIKSASHFV